MLVCNLRQISSICPLFKLAFEGINSWFTGNHVSCAPMAAKAVRVDTNAVCVDDYDNFSRIVRSLYPSFSDFECGFHVFQR